MAPTGTGWVVVSGAGGALGRQIVKSYAAAGRKVLALDQAFEDPSVGDGVSLVAGNLASPDAVKEAIDSVPRGETIALLVNAVGLIWNEPVLSLKGSKLAPHAIESWAKVIEANLTAPFVVASQVAARMARSGGGSIVNFSSISAGGNAGQAAYGAAKAGIESLTRTMAIELGPLGVRSNAVALGFIDVPTTRANVQAQTLEGYVQRTPVGRLGAIEDVLGAIAFFETNAFANGTVLAIDGGLRL